MRCSLLLLLPILIAGCERPKARLGFEPHDAADTTPNTPAAAPAGGVAVRLWTGTLDGSIPVQLGFAEEGQVVAGAVTYTKTARQTPIRLVGRRAPDGTYELREILPDADGSITGIFSGKEQNGVFSGTWYSPQNDRERSFRLQAKDTTLPEQRANLYRLRRGFAAGKYQYGYGKESAAGLLEARANGRAVSLTFSTHTGAPAYNLADLETGPLPLRDGYVAHYTSPDAAYNCQFDVRFYTDFAVVDYQDGTYECGFGHNASVDGFYIRTGN